MKHAYGRFLAKKTYRRSFGWLTALLVVLGVGQPAAAQSLDLYGYFSTRYEKVFNEPSVEDGQIVRGEAPGEWSNPYFNIMMQSRISPRFRAFVNLNGAGLDQIAVQNFWGEFTASRYLSVRLGKLYRRFGLYNEVLDAVPTYYGIEAPELFDGDHLIISRTTTLMLHGNADVAGGVVSYSLTTDNGEGGPSLSSWPLGWDLRYQRGFAFTIGTSGYTTNGETTSDKSVGEGSPDSGVLPWMAQDAFFVIGGFSEINVGNLTLQAAYWHADHNAVRDAEAVLSLLENTEVNAAQRARMVASVDQAGKALSIFPDADYSVDTWYVRSGYSFYTRVGEIAPYAQWDWYRNPETIASKTYGGDAEAGAADDGAFHKPTLGVVYRPLPAIAVKLDASSHIYQLNGETVQYPELRFDVSYIFGQ